MSEHKYLVIAAHPDDEVLGCGGSLAKWSMQGAQTNVLILAEGITSRSEKRNPENDAKLLDQLSKSALISSNILGVDDIKILDFPDNRMDSVDLIEVIKKVEDYISKYRPDTIITHHQNDLNIDHQLINQAVLVACRPQNSCSVKKILTMEVPSSTEWQSPFNGNQFTPNWYEDISDTLPNKIEALRAYSSEMKEFPHPRSYKAVKSLARWRGAIAGYNAAEAFCLIRKI